MNLPPKEQIRYLCRKAEHCISVIALCRLSGSTEVEATYESYLAKINLELHKLRRDTTVPSTHTQASR